MTYTRIEAKNGQMVMRMSETECATCPEECFCSVIPHEGEVSPYDDRDFWEGPTGEWIPMKEEYARTERESQWWDALYELGGES